jgi:hypothetical protein
MSSIATFNDRPVVICRGDIEAMRLEYKREVSDVLNMDTWHVAGLPIQDQIRYADQLTIKYAGIFQFYAFDMIVSDDMRLSASIIGNLAYMALHTDNCPRTREFLDRLRKNNTPPPCPKPGRKKQKWVKKIT